MLFLEVISLKNIGEGLFVYRVDCRDKLWYAIYFLMTFIGVNFFFRNIRIGKVLFTVFTLVSLYQIVFVGSLSLKIVAAFSFLIMTYAADYSVSLIVIHLFKVDFSYIYSSPITYTIVVLTSKTILIMTSYLIKRLFSRKKNSGFLNSIMFAVLPVVTLLTIIAMLRLSLNDNIVYWWFIPLVRGLILANIVVMAALDSMEVENSRLVDTIVFSQRQLVESSTYGAIKEIQEKQMKMAHDIRNHISAVLALQNADSGCDDEYIDRVVNEVLQSSSVVDCNNLTVNAILNLKYTEAVKNGVDILFDINDLSGIQIMEKDLVTILSNAIDNAIENTKEDSNRVIQIKLNDNEYRTVFSIINPSKELVINEGIIQTTKEDKGRHGYGLKNIKSAVENNNGIMVTKYENGYFKLTVVFNK